MPKTARMLALRALSWVLLVSMVVASGPRIAWADAKTDKRELARKLAAEGFDALQRRDYATAEDRFRRADGLVHAPTLVVDHARALAGLGRLVEAHERYELVLREGVAPNAPWQWRLAYADAERELESLKPRLAWLTLRVLGPRQPKVLIDNKPVPVAALGVRRATDPGTHSVSVSAVGFAPKEEIVTLDEGETVALEIELEPDASRHSVERPASRSSAAVPEAEAEAVPETTIQFVTEAPDNTLAYVILGLGGVGIAAGAVTGALALGARSDLEAECVDRVCRPKSRRELQEFEKDNDQYELWGTLSGVSFAVGAAAAATGVAILLLNRGSEEAPQPQDGAAFTRLELRAGLGTVQLNGRF